MAYTSRALSAIAPNTRLGCAAGHRGSAPAGNHGEMRARGRAGAGVTAHVPPGVPRPSRGHDGHPESPGARPPPQTTRQDMGGVRRAEGIDERRHVERAYHPEHQRQVGHGTDLLNHDRHEAPLLQVFSEVAS
jgi:hypothetical protein